MHTVGCGGDSVAEMGLEGFIVTRWVLVLYLSMRVCDTNEGTPHLVCVCVELSRIAMLSGLAEIHVSCTLLPVRQVAPKSG